MFEFDFGAHVKIKCSGEKGEVIGRATYPDRPNQFLIRYAAGDGRAVQDWWDVSAIAAVE